MTNLSRRLRKLETGLLDVTGLVPRSEEWYQYWFQRIDELIEGGNPDLSGMPLEVIDNLLARSREEEAALLGGEQI